MLTYVDEKDVDLRQHILDRYDVFLFDCDGVLYKGNEGVPGAELALESLIASGKLVLFITNNSTKTKGDIVKKLKKCGITSVDEDHVVSSAYATGSYLRLLNFNKKVFCIGEPGLKHEIREAGFDIVPCPSFSKSDGSVDIDELMAAKLDSDVGAVVAGVTYSFSYTQLAMATHYLQNPDVLFIGTNMDHNSPKPNGRILPAGGAVITSIEYASNRKATVVGKPSVSPLVDLLKAQLNAVAKKSGRNGTEVYNEDRVLMIGDRLDTDIAFGRGGGFSTLCVLSGNSTKDHVLTSGEEVRPHYYAESVSVLQAPPPSLE